MKSTEEHAEPPKLDSEPSLPTEQSENFQAPVLIKLMIATLYFAQGLIISIGGTVPYTYKTLPDYSTLSLFTLNNLPFSLKFITAPILEKYFCVSYGKRKTWIIISQTTATIMILVCSFFTELSQATVFAALLIVVMLALSIQDISVDGLCLKELRRAQEMSMLQSAFQTGGNIIGSVLILKLTSYDYAKSIGRDTPIMSLRALLVILCIVVFVPLVFVHFYFRQTFLEDELEPKRKSLLKVYSLYRVFFQPSTRYFRTFLFLMLYTQGANFFYAGYNYKLIDHGVSRNTLNTIDNANLLIQTALICLIGTYANYYGFTSSILVFMSLAIITMECVWIWFPISIPSVAAISFIFSFLLNWKALVSSQMCANFPESGVAGMLYTMNASGANFGKLLFLQTALLKVWSWRNWALFGMCLQVVILFLVPKSIQAIEAGDTTVKGLDDDDDMESSDIPQQDEQQQESPVEDLH